MFAIKAHFEGSVIVPDEPVNLPQNASVYVLADSADSAAARDLEQATRRYYQGLSAEDAKEDEAWGNTLSRGSSLGWA
jgi:hypothetical protein